MIMQVSYDCSFIISQTLVDCIATSPCLNNMSTAFLCLYFCTQESNEIERAEISLGPSKTGNSHFFIMLCQRI